MPKIIAKDITLRYPILLSLNTPMSEQPENDAIITHKSSRYVEAIRNASFEVNPGQRLGLIGRNGSGKSTLLRILGGIYEPTAGSIYVEGSVTSLFNINLGVQPDASGRENILIRGLLKGLRRRDIYSQMDDIIDFAELQSFIDMPLRTYSQGMSMRLAFAIATAFSPEILLLDEWIGAGDERFQVKAQKRMTELVNESGITVIASHNRLLLERVCDIGMWLDRGRIRAYGPIKDVYKMVDEHLKIHGTF